MTSMQGPSQPTDYSFMYEVPDLRSNQLTPKYDQDSLTGFVFKNPEFSIFKRLLLKSDYAEKYSQFQAQYTFFVTRDEDILQQGYTENDFLNIDKYTASQIILYNSINKVISSKSLNNIRDIFDWRSRIQDSLLRFSNMGNGVFVNNARIIGMQQCNNGIVYVLDKLLVNNPMYY
jgi:uncharacterized surface protein with fasciclin (FAS1) repeats